MNNYYIGTESHSENYFVFLYQYNNIYTTLSCTNHLKIYTLKELITRLGNAISKHDPSFDQKIFTRSVFDKNWEDKELKQRMRHIAVCLHQQLPANYKKAIAVLNSVSKSSSGFEYMFFQDYIECYGLNDVDVSLSTLAHFTQYASSEFAIDFVKANGKRSKKVFKVTERDYAQPQKNVEKKFLPENIIRVRIHSALLLMASVKLRRNLFYAEFASSLWRALLLK